MTDSDPYDPDGRLQQLFQVTGEVTILWALLEHLLDDWITIIHHDWGGKNVQSELPRTAFNRKTNYIRKWWDSDETNQIAFPMIPKVADGLDHLADQRHWIIHGAALSISEYMESGTLVLSRRDRRDETKQWEGTTTVEALTDLRTAIFHMTAFLGASTHIFAEPESDTENPFRDLVIKLSRHLKKR